MKLKIIQKNRYNGKKFFKNFSIHKNIKLIIGSLFLTSFIEKINLPNLECIDSFEKDYTQNIEEKEMYNFEISFETIQNLIQEFMTTEKYLIGFYSSIYGVEYEKTYSILSDLTDQFTSDAYVNQFIIGDSTMKGRYVTCTSKEMAILIAVRSIAQNYQKYGLDSQIYTNQEHCSELTYSKQIAYICNVLGVDPALHYAICKTESDFKSEQFLKIHNPSGIRFHGSYAVFPSTMAGFIEQGLELLKYQIDGQVTIEAIGAKHAPVTDPRNASWVSSVSYFYQEATQNYESLFGKLDQPKTYQKR